MGRTERKLKKKTRLERLEVYISRLTQFNSNAMHEMGKLAAALRYYADGSVWDGLVIHEKGSKEEIEHGGVPAGKYVTWKPEEDGPSVARAVLNSLGLPWDKFPTKDGQPADPQQSGVPSVLKNIGEEMRAHKAGLEEDDKSQYGRYTEGGGVERIDPLEVPLEVEHKDDDGIPPEEK